MQAKLISTLFCLLCLAPSALAENLPLIENKNKTIAVGVLAADDAPSGCGCTYQHPKGKSEDTILGWEVKGANETEYAFMRLNGKLAKLKMQGTKQIVQKSKTRDSLGDKRIATFVGDNTTVEVHETAVKVCGKKEESCEVTNYRANLHIRSGSEELTIQTKGLCGC